MTQRRCSEGHCTTILSRWNPEDRCFVHALPQFGRGLTRAARVRRQEELDCDEESCKHGVLEHEDRPMTELEWDAVRRRFGGFGRERSCAVEGCTVGVHARGLCEAHYQFERRLRRDAG